MKLREKFQKPSFLLILTIGLLIIGFLSTELYIKRAIPQDKTEVIDIYKKPYQQYLQEKNWKVYVNWAEKNQFIYYTVRYPSNWLVYKLNPKHLYLIPPPWQEGMELPKDYISIQIKENLTQLPLEDWVKKQYPAFNCVDIVVNSIPSCKLINMVTSASLTNIAVFIPYGKRVSQITLVAQDINKKLTEEAFPYILSSFLNEAKYSYQ